MKDDKVILFPKETEDRETAEAYLRKYLLDDVYLYYKLQLYYWVNREPTDVSGELGGDIFVDHSDSLDDGSVVVTTKAGHTCRCIEKIYQHLPLADNNLQFIKATWSFLPGGLKIYQGGVLIPWHALEGSTFDIKAKKFLEILVGA
jgi:hypothetical protein